RLSGGGLGRGRSPGGDRAVRPDLPERRRRGPGASPCPPAARSRRRARAAGPGARAPGGPLQRADRPRVRAGPRGGRRVIRLVIVLAGIASLVWSVRRWKEAVQVALVLLIFEGAIRKWLVPGAQDLIYFAKDVFLLGAYVGFFQSPERRRYQPPAAPVLYGLLVAGIFLGVLQIFNPNLPNLLVGVLGFKAYFFYVPLIFILPAMFRSDRELAVTLHRYLLL